jgi:hypothetical protein
MYPFFGNNFSYVSIFIAFAGRVGYNKNGKNSQNGVENELESAI